MEEPEDEEHLRFTLMDKSPGADLALVCHALNEDQLETWIRHIKSLLDMQGHFLRGISLLHALQTKSPQKIHCR